MLLERPEAAAPGPEEEGGEAVISSDSSSSAGCFRVMGVDKKASHRHRPSRSRSRRGAFSNEELAFRLPASLPSLPGGEVRYVTGEGVVPVEVVRERRMALEERLRESLARGTTGSKGKGRVGT